MTTIKARVRNIAPQFVAGEDIRPEMLTLIGKVIDVERYDPRPTAYFAYSSVAENKRSDLPKHWMWKSEWLDILPAIAQYHREAIVNEKVLSMITRQSFASPMRAMVGKKISVWPTSDDEVARNYQWEDGKWYWRDEWLDFVDEQPTGAYGDDVIYVYDDGDDYSLIDLHPANNGKKVVAYRRIGSGTISVKTEFVPD